MMQRRHVVLAVLMMMAQWAMGQTGKTVNDSITYAQIKKEKDMTYAWKPEWNVMVANAIDNYGEVLIADSSLNAAQWNALCPDYYKATRAQRKALWVLIIAGMTKYESGFDTQNRFHEPPPLNLYSEGLLQLSYGDEKNYKNLPIDPLKKNILDPEVNLTAGVIILAHQVKKRDVLFTKKHFYWSVLTNKQAEIKAFVKQYVGELWIGN